MCREQIRERRSDTLVNELIRQVETYIEKHRLLPCARLVVGVSGGADSMALLSVLHTLSSEKHWSTDFLVVHVHHGIRGLDADKDEELVRAFCLVNSIPLKVVRLDIPKLSEESGRSLETEGRIRRYEAFEAALAEMPGEDDGCIAVAHHMEDHAESVAMHIFRGCGMEGLVGMRPKNGHIIRPFLDLHKADILKYCEEERIPYREDRTNADSAYTRNFWRNEVFPLIDRGVQISPVEALCGMSRRISEENEYLDQLAKEELDAIRETATPGSISREGFVSAPAALRRRMLRILANETFGDVVDLTEAHWDALLTLFTKENGAGQIDLPGNRLGIRDKNTLRFGMKGSAFAEENGGTVEGVGFVASESDKMTEIPLASLPLGEMVNFSQSFVKMRLLSIEKEAEVVYNSSTWFLPESILSRGVIRTRREGDICCRAGTGVTKELRRFMNEVAIPPRFRDRVLLVMDGQKTLWMPGFLHGEGFTDPASREKYEAARHGKCTDGPEKLYMLELFPDEK